MPFAGNTSALQPRTKPVARDYYAHSSEGTVGLIWTVTTQTQRSRALGGGRASRGVTGRLLILSAAKSRVLVSLASRFATTLDSSYALYRCLPLYMMFRAFVPPFISHTMNLILKVFHSPGDNKLVRPSRNIVLLVNSGRLETGELRTGLWALRF